VATGSTYTDPSDLQPGQSAPFDLIISDDASANMVSGSLNVQSSQYAMILPAVVFKMSESIGEGEVEGSANRGNIDNDGNGNENPPEEDPPEETPNETE
jgi:hypothetical protein